MALEDDFCDVLTKAMRGTRTSASSLAQRTGFGAEAIASWAKGRAMPDEGEARALAGALGLDPGKLADAALRRWHPDPVHASDVRRHGQSPHPSNGYVFFLEGSQRAALVDPAGIAENLVRILRDGAYALEYILITHKHPDHCDATAAVRAKFPQAKIVMHRADVHAIGELARSALPVEDGAELPFGDAVIRLLHTPGHTDGSSSYLFRSTVFTGDTLFAGSVGGAYGDKTTYADILNSVRSLHLYASGSNGVDARAWAAEHGVLGKAP